MKLAFYIACKIKILNQSQKTISQIIILISQITVVLGFFIALLSISIGIGIKKHIKQRLADFNGHLVLKNLNIDNNYNSSILKLESWKLNLLKKCDKIIHIQQFATLGGIIKKKKNFEGLIFKGVSYDFDIMRFHQFLIAGKIPFFSSNSISNEIIISKKNASKLNLKISDVFIMYFFLKNREIIFRKFKVVGIFNTYIKNIDDNYLIGDINQIRNINGWHNNEISGYELYLNDIENSDFLIKKLSPIFKFDFFFEKSTEIYSQIINWLNLFDINIYVLIFIMLFIILLNMIMVLLILIIERITFIGTMKMLGMTNYELQKIFICYTLLVMIPGLLIGNVLTFFFLIFQQKFNIIKLNPEYYFFESVPVDLNLMYFLVISVFFFLLSFIVLIIPSHLISKFNPIQILKFT